MARILIIDDEAPMRTVLRECLQNGEHYIAEASSGDEGLAYLRRKPVDLVVTDLFMPNVDGFALIEGLRQELPALKILVVSGAGGIDDPDEYLGLALRMGAHAVLSKPLELDKLTEMVETLLAEGT